VPAGRDAQEPEKVVNVAVAGVVAPIVEPFIDPPEMAAPEIIEPEIVPLTIELLIMDPPETYPALVILSTT
jgi:exosome complex RNA-binding protein Rrp42 (RNase PH superfamily)